jgi:hypothetical protein
MTVAELETLKGEIAQTLGASTDLSPAQVLPMLPVTKKTLQGKLYEARVLAEVCVQLVNQEGCIVIFGGGSNVVLKLKGSPIDRSYAYFLVERDGEPFGELFTDIYFSTLSFTRSGRALPDQPGDFHELDIALVEPDANGKPNPDQIYLAIECKDTAIKKSIIRELLGFRRELSYLHHSPTRTIFRQWPAKDVSAKPASVHMLYTTDRLAIRFTGNCAVFGTFIEHFRI